MEVSSSLSELLGNFIVELESGLDNGDNLLGDGSLELGKML